MIQFIKDKIKAFVVKKATANKMIDIVEVRTKDIGLTQVTTETDIRISNSFFLPISILSIKTDLLNRDGLKVGRMSYDVPRKIKGNSHEVLTTTSQISIITSLFQALSSLLSQHITMQSVGVASIKFLWWTFEIPVNDFFEIHPSKLKIVRELTEEELKAREEERLIRAHDKEIKTVLKQQDKALRDIETAKRRAERKEEILKRRYKDNYIPKEERQQLQESPQAEEINFTVELDSTAIQQMADASKVSENTDVSTQNNSTIQTEKSTTDSDNI